MNVNLHIERLIVEGLPLQGRDRQALQADIERRLAHLFTTTGIPAGLHSPGSVDSLAAPAIRVDSASGPRPMGMQIGDSIHAGLSQAATEHGERNMRAEP